MVSKLRLEDSPRFSHSSAVLPRPNSASDIKTQNLNPSKSLNFNSCRSRHQCHQGPPRRTLVLLGLLRKIPTQLDSYRSRLSSIFVTAGQLLYGKKRIPPASRRSQTLMEHLNDFESLGKLISYHLLTVVLVAFPSTSICSTVHLPDTAPNSEQLVLLHAARFTCFRISHPPFKL